ncbi:unnamed protein product [Musa acuminata subsp. malaccensis]|uniref:(wild Malaysian banana) hypothetical protein n=1 Tax=Musa acuminata subsp. malaccensis TaxID=214687 RepID=A0A804JQL9_MUSAM|nr:unnamed protein product [Musa acuminata subsp. malaccensis]
MLLTATTRGRGRHRGACDFSGTATLTTTDPSNSGCAYPASSSASGTSSTPATSTPPTTFTPTNGVLGGLGPSGSLTSDVNHGGFLLRPGIGWLLLTLICSGIGFDATVVAMAVQKWICDSADVDAEAYLLVRG